MEEGTARGGGAHTHREEVCVQKQRIMGVTLVRLNVFNSEEGGVFCFC